MTTRDRLLGSTWRRPLAGLTLALVTTAALAACSGSGSDSSDASGGGSQSRAESRALADGSDADSGADSGEAGAAAPQASSRLTGSATSGRDVPRVPEKVISTGSVSLVSDDVAETRFDVQRVTDQRGGEVAESQTDTADDGEVERSRMVLRVPVKEFAATMEAVEGLAELRSSEQGSEVVTEKYVDLQARVRAQEASLARVELLFTRAQGIRDVMAIEGQLTSRQADLDALKGRLRTLDDRATMSTITVHVERTPTIQEQRDSERAGFLAGLAGGWEALSAAAVVAATAVGALLPFAVVLAVVGLPLWLLVRASRRRRSGALATGRPGGSAGQSSE